MSRTGIPSVMAMITSIPASAASMMESAANGGGTKIIVALAPVCRHGLVDGVEDGDAEGRLPPFAGGHAADELGPVGLALFGVEGAGFTSDPLADELGILIDDECS